MLDKVMLAAVILVFSTGTFLGGYALGNRVNHPVKESLQAGAKIAEIWHNRHCEDKN